MKLFYKISAGAVSAVMALSAMAIPAFGAGKPETTTGSAAYAASVIKVDGEKDAAYNSSPVLNADFIAEENFTPDPEYSAKSWASWDINGIYIFTDITDPTITYEPVNSWNDAKSNDRIKYNFDFANLQIADNGNSSDGVKGLCIDIALTPSGNYQIYAGEDASTSLTAECLEKVKADPSIAVEHAIKKKSDNSGYCVEIRVNTTNLEWKSGRFKPSDNAKIGLDIYSMDKESFGSGRVLYTWSRDYSNMSWDNPAYNPTLTLLAKPAGLKEGFVDGKYYVKGKLAKNQYVLYNGKTVFIGSDGRIVRNAKYNYAGKTYYANQDGTKLINSFRKIGSNRYYFGADGAMVKNRIITVKGKSYIIGSNGAMITGTKWKKFKGKTYRLVKNVIQKKKTVKVGKKRYLLDKNGVKVTGTKWKKVGTKQYYVKKGVVQTNKWIGKYRTDKKGAKIKNKFFKVGKKRYYANKRGRIYKNTAFTVKGKYYRAKADGSLYRSQTLRVGSRVYVFAADGSYKVL